MANYTQLRSFKKDELLFDGEETRIILKFIFEPADHEFIDSLTVNDSVRGFTQALLIEAIDASYAVGFVEAIFRSTTNPAKGAMKILKSFGKKAATHWFKHARVHDLQDVKVYDFIRIYIANQFRKPLRILVVTSSLEKQPGVFLEYKKPSHGLPIAWG